MPDTRERWFADGWELTDPTNLTDWTSYEGVNSTSGLVGDTSRLPGRHGEMWTPKQLGPGSFALNFYFGSASVDGPRTDLWQRWENLVRRVQNPHALTRWERWLPDGSKRECYGQVVASMKPSYRGQRLLVGSVEVYVPSGTWTDLADLDTGVLGPSGGPIPLTPFIGATAPLTELLFTVNAGPVTVLDPVTGSWFQQSTSSGSITVNAKTDQVTTSDLSGFTYRGPYLIEVGQHVADNFVPRLTVSNSRTIRVQGRRQYVM